MVNLEALSADIAGMGEKIKELKSDSGSSPEAISAAVEELLRLKKEYADNNNGIGVDGKPFEKPLSKAEKKAKEKAEKAAAAASAAGAAATSAVSLSARGGFLSIVFSHH
jgi:WHEP-TRS domain